MFWSAEDYRKIPRDAVFLFMKVAGDEKFNLCEGERRAKNAQAKKGATPYFGDGGKLGPGSSSMRIEGLALSAHAERGLVHLGRLKRWKAAGYRIEIVYLRLLSPRLALRRIAARVKQGDHNVPRADVLRRLSGAGRFSRVLPSFGRRLECV
jgi:hypothetical protein